MAAIIALPIVYGIEKVKEKRKLKQKELLRSRTDPAPSYSVDPSPAQQAYARHLEEAREHEARARESYEGRVLNSSTEDDSSHDDEEDADAPPPYAGAVPAYGEHRQDPVLMSNRDRSNVHPALRSSLENDFPVAGRSDSASSRPERQVGEIVDRFESPARPRGRMITLNDGRVVEVSPERPGETEEQRRKRKYKEFWSFKGGMFWSIFGVNMTAF